MFADLFALPSLSAIKSTEIGNKTANINIKKQLFIHNVKSEWSTTANVIKKISPTIMLPKCQCDAK